MQSAKYVCVHTKENKTHTKVTCQFKKLPPFGEKINDFISIFVGRKQIFRFRQKRYHILIYYAKPQKVEKMRKKGRKK